MSLYYWAALVVLPLVLNWQTIKAFLRKVYLAENLPGPTAYPPIGNALLFIGVPIKGE